MNDPIILWLESPEYSLLIWEICGKQRLDGKLLELRDRWGWPRKDLNKIRDTWILLREGTTGSINSVNLAVVNQMIGQLWLINKYSIKWVSGAFEGIDLSRKALKNFKPVPFTPCLNSVDGVHYLDMSVEKKEILLQGWIYCGFEPARFKFAVKQVWGQYAMRSHFDCGWAGEAESFASAFRNALDNSNVDEAF